MPHEQAVIVFIILLSLMILLGTWIIFYVLRKQKENEARASCLTANEIKNCFNTSLSTQNFLFSVTQKSHSFLGAHLLVRNEEDETVGFIRFPRTQHPLIRIIECGGEVYECIATLAVLDNRVSLRRQGGDDELLCFEPKLTREDYTKNGQVVYSRELFNLSTVESWSYTSNNENVAYLKNMNKVLKLNGKLLTVSIQMPLAEQLFIIAMSHHLNGTE